MGATLLAAITHHAVLLAGGLRPVPGGGVNTGPSATGPGLFSFLSSPISSVLTSLSGAGQCGITITNLFQLILYLVAEALNGLLSAIWGGLVWVLKHTLLNTGTSGIVMGDYKTLYASLSGMVAAIAVAAFVYRLFHVQVEGLTGHRREEMHSLAGRTLLVFAWMGGGVLFLRTILAINDTVVRVFTKSMALDAWKGVCATPANAATQGMLHVGTAAGTGLIVFVFSEFFMMVAIGLILFVVIQWIARLFEVLWWATLMPIALAVSLADPAQKMWEFVKSNLIGAVFVQSCMAFGFWMITKLFMQSGTLFHGGTAADILNTGMALAGFWFIGKLPQYWQQLNGHVTSGGHETAGLAMGYMAGRLGSQVLASTTGGQILGQMTDAAGARHADELQHGTSLVGRLGGSAVFRRLQNQQAFHAASHQAGRARDEAANPGIADLQLDARSIQDRAGQQAMERHTDIPIIGKDGEVIRQGIPTSFDDVTGGDALSASEFADQIAPGARGALAQRERRLESSPATQGLVRKGRDGRWITTTPAMRQSVDHFNAINQAFDQGHNVDAISHMTGISPQDLETAEGQKQAFNILRDNYFPTPGGREPQLHAALSAIRQAQSATPLPGNWTAE